MLFEIFILVFAVYAWWVGMRALKRGKGWNVFGTTLFVLAVLPIFVYAIFMLFIFGLR